MGHEVGVRKVGGQGRRSDLYTPTPDAFATVIQDPDTYYTTTQLAKILRRDQKLIHRWCQRWYGALPRHRRGRGMGYRIHLDMLRVARGWLQTEDELVRGAIKRALLEESRDWVVVVGEEASTHYTPGEAQQRVSQFLLTARNKPQVISVMYVGEPQTGEE